MKKLLTLLLSLALLACLAACAPEEDPTTEAQKKPSQSQGTTQKQDDPRPTESQPKPTDSQPTEPKPTEHVHSYTENVTAPSCAEKGYTSYTCSCGDGYIDHELEALCHSYDSTGLCTRCGDKTKFSEGLEYGYVTESGKVIGLKVSGIGSCTDTDVVIPPTYRPYSFSDVQYPVLGIGNRAFEDCTALTSVTIPNSVTSIGGSAFENCTGLTSITIPNSVTSIDYAAFKGCTNLSSISIPDSVTKIDSYTFQNCSSLQEVVLPEGIVSIASNAFANCTSLENISIPTSVQSISRYAFSDCPVEKKENCVTYVDNWVLKIYPDNNTVTLREGTVAIASGALASYPGTKMNTLVIPESVVNISSSAFNSVLVSFDFQVAENNPAYCAIDGVLYAKDGKTLVYCSNQRKTSYAVPDGVTAIGEYAFYFRNNLVSISFADSLVSIGGNAFEGCSKLTSIIFEGTMEQWNAIEKGSSWDNGTGAYTVYCTDGEIKKGE